MGTVTHPSGVAAFRLRGDRARANTDGQRHSHGYGQPYFHANTQPNGLSDCYAAAHTHAK